MPIGSPQTIVGFRNLTIGSPIQTWSDPWAPGDTTHDLFATSDNKLVMFFQGLNNATASTIRGAVIVLDGTTASVPGVIGYSAFPAVGRRAHGGTDETKEVTIQLTDTRYARIADFTPFSGSPILTDKIIEIVDVNLTTGASTVPATLNVNSFLTFTSSTFRQNLFRISDTEFAFVAEDDINSPLERGISLTVLKDNGSSISVQAGPFTVVTRALSETGSPTARPYNQFTGELSSAYLGSNRVFVVETFHRDPSFNDDGYLTAGRFNATFTTIEALGVPTIFYPELSGSPITGGGTDTNQLYRYDDTHVIHIDANRRGDLDPGIYVISNINPTTLSITTGKPDYFTGKIDTSLGRARQLIVASNSKAYLITPFDDRTDEVPTGSRKINITAFDGTQELLSSDRVVDTAANLTTDWPTPGAGQNVLAVDTGFIHRWNGSSWDGPGSPQITNSRRWDNNGVAVFELTIDTATLSVTQSKQEWLVNETFPRWESDGAGGIRFTGINASRSINTRGGITELPNGKITCTWRAEAALKENAPFFTEAAFNAAGVSNAAGSPQGYQFGGDIMGLYFDPSAMP